MTCYYPDGSPSPLDTPCNATAPASHCCSNHASCLSTGYCLGGYDGSPAALTRGSCTDPNFHSGACAQHCKDTYPDRPNYLTIVGATAKGPTYCCNTEYDSGTGTCQNTTEPKPFTLDFGDIIINRQDGSTSSRTVASLPPSSSAVAIGVVTTTAAAVQNETSDTTKTIIAVGVGVAVPLLLLLILFAIMLFYLTRRRRRAERRLTAEMKSNDRKSAEIDALRRATSRSTTTRGTGSRRNRSRGAGSISSPEGSHQRDDGRSISVYEELGEKASMRPQSHQQLDGTMLVELESPTDALTSPTGRRWDGVKMF